MLGGNRVWVDTELPRQKSEREWVYGVPFHVQTRPSRPLQPLSATSCRCDIIRRDIHVGPQTLHS